jgi:hypothetical protein
VKEATNTINIDNFTASTVKMVLEFMYTKDYKTEQGEIDDSISESKLTKHFGGHFVLGQDGRLVEAPADYALLAHRGGPLVTADKSVTDNLLCHIEVNAAADYYGIPSLKKLANTKIGRIFQKSWCAEGFPTVVSAISESTSDVELWDLIANVAASRIDELLELESFNNLRVSSDFYFRVIRNMAAAHRAKEQQHNQQAASARADLQRELVRGEDERKAAVSMLRDLVREAVRPDTAIESVDSCARCRCRHKSD